MKITKLQFALMAVIVLGTVVIVAKEDYREIVREGALKILNYGQDLLEENKEVLNKIPVLNTSDKPAPQLNDDVEDNDDKVPSVKKADVVSEDDEEIVDPANPDIEPATDEPQTVVKEIVEVVEIAPPYKDVASIIRFYLNADYDDVKQKSTELFRTLDSKEPIYTPARALLSHMMGRRVLSKDQLYTATQDDAGMCALGYLTLFLDAVRSRKITSAQYDELKDYLDNYKRNAEIANDKYVSFFVKRVEDWKTWLNSNCNATENLEKIFHYGDEFEKLSSVSRSAFIARYKKMKGRPSFEGLEYNENTVKTYLRSITEPVAQRAENMRISRYGKQKTYIVHLFARNTYTGTLFFKSGNKRGTINLVNENSLLMKGSTKAFKWSDFKIEMYGEFLEYFGQRRTGAGTKSSATVQSKDAAEDFLSAAVVYHIGGNFEKAYDAAIKAEKMNEEVAASVKKMFADAIEL